MECLLMSSIKEYFNVSASHPQGIMNVNLLCLINDLAYIIFVLFCRNDLQKYF